MSLGRNPSELAINGRFTTQPLTGVQRVAISLTDHLKVAYEVLAPNRPLGGPLGHLWEQTVLPSGLKGRLLWSPCNVGPVLVGRQVLSIHDAAVLDHPEWFSPSFVRTYRTIWRAMVGRIAAIVTVSAFSRDRLAHHFGLPPAAIEVVPNGVSANFAPATAGEIASMRTAIGIEAERYFVCLGTLEPRKNFGLVMAAWAQARQELPRGTKLLVVGGMGPRRIFADSNADRGALEDAVFLGHVEDRLLPTLLSGATGLIYPSLYEGFGLPVLEGMACGAPVLTTNRSAIPEVGGDAVVYVDPDDPEDLARAIVRLAESKDLRDACMVKGLERATQFNWDATADQMQVIFERHS